MKRIDLALLFGCGVRVLTLFGLASLLGGCHAPAETPAPFTRAFVFGDSLSDTGNFHHLNGGARPVPPYFEGRFSNGPLWVEHLVNHLGLELLPDDNYAVGGATTGTFNSNNGLFGLEYPGLQHQIGAFLAAHGPAGADPDALYVVWAGANDFFVALPGGGAPAELIASGVANTVQAVRVLWQAGARHILLLNVPDLGLTPFGLDSGMGETITAVAAAYNSSLAAALQALAESGVPTIQVDAFSMLQTMVNSPETFGFTEVAEPFSSVGDPAGFLFWDAVHPTTRGHEILAEAALERLVEHYLPGRGRGLPAARVNALRGLVGAGLPR